MPRSFGCVSTTRLGARRALYPCQRRSSTSRWRRGSFCARWHTARTGATRPNPSDGFGLGAVRPKLGAVRPKTDTSTITPADILPPTAFAADES